MLRITQDQHLLLRKELLRNNPNAYVPSHEIVSTSHKHCLTTNELWLIIFILNHDTTSSAGVACLQKSFCQMGLDEIAFKVTKWSLIRKELIALDDNQRLFYTPAIEKYIEIDSDEMDTAFAVFEDDSHSTVSLTSSDSIEAISSEAISAIVVNSLPKKPHLHYPLMTPTFFYSGSFTCYAAPTNTNVDVKIEIKDEPMTSTPRFD